MARKIIVSLVMLVALAALILEVRYDQPHVKASPIHTLHIPPANPNLNLAPLSGGTAFESCTGSGTVQCSEDGVTWYAATVVNGVSKCKPPTVAHVDRDAKGQPCKFPCRGAWVPNVVGSRQYLVQP